MAPVVDSLPVNYLSSEPSIDSMLMPSHVRKQDAADISADARQTAIYPRSDQDNEFHQSKAG